MMTAAVMQLLLTWQQQRENPGSNATSQEGQVDHDLAGLDVTSWNEVYHELITLTPTANSVEIDLEALLNYVSCDEFAFTKVLVLWVKNLGDESGEGDGIVALSPGTFDYFFLSGSDGIKLPPGRVFVIADDVASPAAGAESAYSDRDVTGGLSLELLSGSDTTVEIAIIGSTELTV